MSFKIVQLNDVKYGGYTAFPVLYVISPAEKGAALIWDNSHLSNGSLHDSGFHGSCAILKGDKWSKYNKFVRKI